MHVYTSKNHRALTIMELLIVVAIVAVIVAVGYPNYSRAKEEARRADAHVALVALEGVIERYLVENNKAQFDASDLALSQFTNYSSGAGTPVFSNEGYYRIVISTDSSGYILQATAVAGNGLGTCNNAGNENVGQCGDLKCRSMYIDHGERTSEDDNGVTANAATTTCW